MAIQRQVARTNRNLHYRPDIDRQRRHSRYNTAFLVRSTHVGLRLAPPTSAPSMSGCAIKSATFSWLDAAAVLDADLVGRCVAGQLAQGAPDDVADDVLGAIRVAGPAGADRPDGFVGDHDFRQVGGRDGLQRRSHLLRHQRIGEAGFILFQILADADNGGELVVQGGQHLCG